MNGKLKLAPLFGSMQTVEVLEDLLAEARNGRLIGLAFVAMYQGHEYSVSAAGEALRSPTFSRGTIAALDDYLRALLSATGEP